MKPAVIIISSVAGADLESAATEARKIVGDVLVAESPGGYGVALRDAMSRAVEIGCTHAIVLDAGRGHAPEYLPNLIEAVRQTRDAIVVGVRQYSVHRPSIGQRFGRWHCDFWTWAETGRWVHDTTYGFKAYPLDLINDIAVRAHATDFEVELLAKAIWAGIHVVEVPLLIDARVEVLAPLTPAEVARFGATTWRLTLQRLILPSPLLATMHRKNFAYLPLLQRLRVISREAIAHSCEQPSRFAACVGLGVFFGIAPIWGFQMLAAAATAHLLRLSKPIVLAASQISSPLTVPLILYASLLTGHLLFRGKFAGLPQFNQLQRRVLLQFLGEYLAGSLILAVCAGLLSVLLAFLAATTLKSLRGNARC